VPAAAAAHSMLASVPMMNSSGASDPSPPARPESRTDTRPEWKGTGPVRRARGVRRALLCFFGAFLLLGMLGVFGVREGTVRAEGGGFTLVVHYPRVTRPGHAVPLRFEIHKVGGFGDQPITISTTAKYFDLFDENAIDPSPSAETATGEDLIWEFDPPPGDVMLISTDTRTGPNRWAGSSAKTAILVEGFPVVSVTYDTRVMP